MPLVDDPPQPVTLGAAIEGHAYYDADVATRGTQATMVGVNEEKITRPGWKLLGPYYAVTTEIRCDHDLPEATPGSSLPGCVFHHYIPYMIFDETTHPVVGPVAEHIYDAQKTLPSEWRVEKNRGTSNMLNRLTDESQIENNRATACVGTAPSCDEYPMASTYQGAAFSPPGDWSARTVPAAANSSQGGIMGNFYAANRILDQDAYWVWVKLADGRTSW
ncbi:NucA/NucB deoxyribonuclease domain-containing protein [Actinocorallia libanotica]|uniref:Deoxyribonuclease NucA/NucB domain-containing protein n=1 Tax=Actinocorallia libanotica TaxID=46162 RepID=A0ABN1S2E7_9ACTN